MRKARSQFIRRWLPRVSLRELLGIIAFVAVACGALQYASEGWVLVLFSTLCLLVVVLLILAFIERGARQAGAIGALVVLAVYGFLWTYEPKVETVLLYRPPASSDHEISYNRHLPSTILLNLLWLWLRGSYVVDSETGEVVDKLGTYEPYLHGQPAKGGVLTPPANWKSGLLIIKNRPLPEHIVPVGHCLWAFLFAYLGSKFAVWVYERRAAREAVSDDT